MTGALYMGAILRRARALPWKGLFALGVAASVMMASADPAFARRRGSEDRQEAKKEKKEKAPRREGPLFAVVSIADQRVSFYGAEGLVERSAISSGQAGHRTPTGVFAIVQKQVYHTSNIYSGAPMPFMQRITWSGVAMHAGVLPGYPASHGCIRLPHSFAQKIYGLTKMGQRVVVSPRDLVPADVQHANLPSPKLQPAPGEPASPPATAENTPATMSDASTGATPATVSVAEATQSVQPRAVKLLNPLEYAVAMRNDANARSKAASLALKSTKAANGAKEEDARVAARSLKSAENAVQSLEQQIASVARKIERTKENVEDAKKGIEAKPALEARIAEAQKALEEAQKAKIAKDQELKDAWQAASKLESEGKEAEAKAADDFAGNKEDEARTAGKAVKAAETTLRRLQEQVESAARKATRAQEELARIEANIAKLNEEKAALEAKMPDAQRLVQEASLAKAAKDKELEAAEKAVEDAETAVETILAQIKESARRLEPVSVFISRKTGRLYVRQGFRSVFDVPVTIKDRERPIGTHVFVSTEALNSGTQLRWSAVSMPDDEEKKPASRDGKRKRTSAADEPETTAAIVLPPETPASALDRIEIPNEAKLRLSELTWIGAMLTISDRAMSGETNESTDFVILTHSRAN
jgi:lipoprotein-anchoring transpeptidase ErfK/SrfK